MPITTDTFGNTFAGNFLAGDSWDANNLLTLMRTALGNNDRANINLLTSNSWRIDWRPNILEETLTGTIPVPPTYAIDGVLANGTTLAANSRMSISLRNTNTSNPKNAFLLNTGSLQTSSGNVLSPTFSGFSSYWAVAREDSVSVLVFNSVSSYAFISCGILKNSGIGFPNNRYGIYLRQDPGVIPSIMSSGINGSTVIPFFSSTAIANYPHNDGSATTDEMGLYLRRASDNQHLGYIPNVFKFTVDGGATTPAIGDIVNLNMSAGIGFYAGQEIIKCIVVGRLGNTSDTDLTGDFLLMKVAS